MDENRMIEEQNEGVSLEEIFSWIWAKKIIGLIVAGALFLIMFLGIFLIYNPSARKYVIHFQYADIPSLDSGSYLDGSSFNYRELISESNVNKVITSSPEKYKEVDATKLFASNDFSISVTYNYLDEKNQNYTIVSTNYTINMPASIFKSQNIAKDFALDLIQIPVEKTLNIIDGLTYKTNLILSAQSNEFESQISYLTTQTDLLISGYDGWIAANTANTSFLIDGNNFTLQQLKNEITQYLTEQDFYAFSEELNLKGYVKSPEAERSKYELQLAGLKDARDYLTTEKEELEQQLSSLYSQLGLGSGTGQSQVIITEAITVLISKITDVNTRILSNEKSQRDVQRKLDTITAGDSTESTAFGLRLKAIEEKLTEFTETYASVSKTLYQRDMNIYYSNSNVIKTEGGLSMIITLVASAFVGLICGVFVAGVIGYNYQKKKNEQETI